LNGLIAGPRSLNPSTRAFTIKAIFPAGEDCENISPKIFPVVTRPAEGYTEKSLVKYFHNLHLQGNIAFIVKARVEGLRDLGPAISPFNSFLLLQGLETLSLRMERHIQNTLALAKWLGAHQGVEKVNYPGLKGSPYHELAKNIFPKGAGGVLSFYT